MESDRRDSFFLLRVCLLGCHDTADMPMVGSAAGVASAGGDPPGGGAHRKGCVPETTFASVLYECALNVRSMSYVIWRFPGEIREPHDYRATVFPGYEKRPFWNQKGTDAF